MNFALFMRSDMGTSEATNGNLGTSELRAFSGIWLAFYSVAAAMLYPPNERKEEGFTYQK